MDDSAAHRDGSTVCNCMYGPTDPRCCIARAQRKLLEDAWEMGRRGEPLPPVRSHARLDACSIGRGMLSMAEIRRRENEP